MVNRGKTINDTGYGVLIAITMSLEDNLPKNVIGKRTSAAQAIASKSGSRGSGYLNYTGKNNLDEREVTMPLDDWKHGLGKFIQLMHGGSMFVAFLKRSKLTVEIPNLVREAKTSF